MAKAELSKQKSLNEKLETDLLALDNRSANLPSMSGPSGAEDALAGLGLDLGLENTKNKKGESSGSTARSTPIPFTSSADTSILPIVTSQRDRFRARNAKLEEVAALSFSLIHVFTGHATCRNFDVSSILFQNYVPGSSRCSRITSSCTKRCGICRVIVRRRLCRSWILCLGRPGRGQGSGRWFRKRR